MNVSHTPLNSVFCLCLSYVSFSIIASTQPFACPRVNGDHEWVESLNACLSRSIAPHSSTTINTASAPLYPRESCTSHISKPIPPPTSIRVGSLSIHPLIRQTRPSIAIPRPLRTATPHMMLRRKRFPTLQTREKLLIINESMPPILSCFSNLLQSAIEIQRLYACSAAIPYSSPRRSHLSTSFA